MFRFAAALCRPCPLRSQCVRGRGGRTVQLHPQEKLLQEARRFQTSPFFATYRSLRQVVEHRLARLVQLGIRQARYRGRLKTLFQLLMVATVANLTLVASKLGIMVGHSPFGGLRAGSGAAASFPGALPEGVQWALRTIEPCLRRFPKLLLLSPSLAQPSLPAWGYRPDF